MVTGNPELNRLTDQVKASLPVDPAELRKSGVFPLTQQERRWIAQQMSAYMAGY